MMGCVQTFKFTGSLATTLTTATKCLEQHAAAENAAKNLREASKAEIAKILLQERQIDINNLPDKEIIIVECDGVATVTIKRKSMNRFDNKGFAMAHPELAKDFTRPLPVTYIDSLLK